MIAYFSHTGNTEPISSMIAEHTGSDLFKAETATVYPEEYNVLIGQNRTADPFCLLCCRLITPSVSLNLAISRKQDMI